MCIGWVFSGFLIGCMCWVGLLTMHPTTVISSTMMIAPVIWGCMLKNKRGNFKPTEIDSDIESTKGSVHNGPGSSHCSNLGMIPPDALYSKEPQRRDSPKSVSSRLGTDYAVAKNRAENKGRGDIIYADLQLPKTSNNGSMRLNKPTSEKTNYAEIKFPVYEKADL